MTGRCVWEHAGTTGRDSHFLTLIKRASGWARGKRFSHYEAEREEKDRERQGERERDERDRERVRRLDSQVLFCY